MIPTADSPAHARPALPPPGPVGPLPPTGGADPPAGTGAHVRLLTLAALTVALIGLCVLLAVPFLPAITWGVALAILAWPLHRWIGQHVARPGLAAATSAATVVVVLLVPGLFVTYHLAREAGPVAARMQGEAAEGGLRAQMARVPGLRHVVAWMDRVDVDLEREIRQVMGSYTQDLAGLAQGSVTAAIQCLVAVFILYYLFRDRAAFQQGLRDLLPLSRAESAQVFARAADSVHANLYATFVTSLLDATGGGLLFWGLGLPAPLLWASVMFVLSILPVVGAALVWLPAAASLALAGQWPAAAALVGWGVLSFLVVDNIIYVRLAGERMRMHEVPALVAFLGGVAVFGLSGMILGPAILAVTAAVVEVWKQRLASTEGPPDLGDPAGASGGVSAEPERRAER